MLAKTFSYGLSGLDAFPIQIEVDVGRGLPMTTIVGLPDNAVRESKERVRSAIRNSGFDYTLSRTIINLSPANIRKEGPAFDLAMALGFLAATEQVPLSSLNDKIFLGELSLDGSLKPVRGALSVAMTLLKHPQKTLILPSSNAIEAGMTGHPKLYPVRTLREAVHLLSDPDAYQPYHFDRRQLVQTSRKHSVDFSDVKGQRRVKRGLEIAAAGGHNVLMIGPPGSGKSMLAQRLVSILPQMNDEELLETTKIHSVMGLIRSKEGIMTHRPFRTPHHTSSDVALVGGGSIPKPGEVTLSHNGVLFLDELPEFSRNVLESLRQPLEDHVVTIARAHTTVRFPSQFMLIAAMNPCPCGHFTNPFKTCTCTQAQIQKYLSKISGPLLDRIDLHLEVPPLPTGEMMVSTQEEPSAAIQNRAVGARDIQTRRFHGTAIRANAFMDHRAIKKFCPLSDECKTILRDAVEQLHLSARAYDKILKIARTIADLGRHEEIQPEHLCEAIQYRALDREWWG